MRPRTREEMDTIMRSLVRDCLTLAEDAKLTKSDLAKLLGTSRINLYKWSQHMQDGGTWETLPVSGASAATLFLNLLIVRAAVETAVSSGELPAANSHKHRRWVDSTLDPAR